MKKEEEVQIHLLLERYYQGETTLVEEQYLKRYFKSGIVPSGMEADKVLFQAMNQSPPIPCNKKVSEEMLHQIRRQRGKGLLIRIAIATTAVAACALLLISIRSIQFHSQNDLVTNIEQHDTFSDPNVAYKEAVKALTLVSSMLREGNAKADMMSSTIFRPATKEAHCLSNLTSFEHSLNLLNRYSNYLNYFELIQSKTHKPIVQ